MQINNLTNDLELVWSATDKETIPKLGLRTRIAGDFVHLIMSAGDRYAQQPTLKIDYNDVTSPTVTTVEELRDAILVFAASVSLGGSGGGGGGGNDTYDNIDDFTATANVGTKTITVTALPYTLEGKHVVGGALIKKENAAGEQTVLNLSTVQVAGGIITLANIDDFVAGETISYMVLKGPDKYDSENDSQKVSVDNPKYAHYTDPEHIVDATNATVDQHYSGEIFPASYPYLEIQLTANATTGAAGVAFKFWGTLNPDAATPADLDAAPSTDWADISAEILGAAIVTLGTVATESKVYTIDRPTMYYKYIIQYDPGHATNTVDVFIRKFSA